MADQDSWTARCHVTRWTNDGTWNGNQAVVVSNIPCALAMWLAGRWNAGHVPGSFPKLGESIYFVELTPLF
jgi:hypothetical protein